MGESNLSKRSTRERKMFVHTLRQKSGTCLPSVSSRRITWLSAARPSEPGSPLDLAGAIEKDCRVLIGQWIWAHLWPTKLGKQRVGYATRLMSVEHTGDL